MLYNNLHNNIGGFAQPQPATPTPQPQPATPTPSSKLDAVHQPSNNRPLNGMYDGLHVPMEYIKSNLHSNCFAKYQDILKIKNLEKRGDAIFDFSANHFGTQPNAHIGTAIFKQAASTYCQAGEKALLKGNTQKAAHLFTKGINAIQQMGIEGSTQYKNEIIADLSKVTGDLSLINGSKFEAKRHYKTAANYYSLNNDMNKVNQMRSLIHSIKNK